MKISTENISKINLIDILSDGISECLIVENELNSLTFRTDYTFYKFIKNNLAKISSFFPELDNIPSQLSLFEKIKSEILIYFSSGFYTIEITELNISNVEILNDEKITENSIYTENDILFFTKSKNEISAQIINGYKRKILESKTKPIIIIAGTEYFENFDPQRIEEYGSDYTKFIINGHHKLLAYKELRINPRIVSIVKLNDLNERRENFLDEYSIILNKNELNEYKKSL